MCNGNSVQVVNCCQLLCLFVFLRTLSPGYSLLISLSQKDLDVMFRASLSSSLKLNARRAPIFVEKRFTTILCVRKNGKVVCAYLFYVILQFLRV